MRYESTRGAAPAVDFAGTVLEGLAPDGGLYLPTSWPQVFSPDLAGLPYAGVAERVLTPLVGDSLGDRLPDLCGAAWSGFAHPDVTPLRDLGDDTFLLELFHGPTLAFKDVALQLLGRLFDHLLTARGERRTVLGATSGDTGSAAIEGCRGLSALDVFILHPHGRTSDVQRRQMTTVLDANVHNGAVRGTFDDAQDAVKALFHDPEARDSLRLTAVNSISWARVAAQIVYYVVAAARLGTLDVVVPTGNFGDIFAGWCARQMGAPIRRLHIASNANDILPRVVHTGEYRITGVHPTLSPSMDIQVSSNFERLLWELTGRDTDRLRGWMTALRTDGGFRLDPATHAALRAQFDATATDDPTTLATITDVWQRHGLLVDPHTATGLAAARRHPRERGVPVVVLATADAAKFPDAVQRATGQRPPLPNHLADLFDRPERYDVIDADPASVRAWIHARR